MEYRILLMISKVAMYIGFLFICFSLGVITAEIFKLF